ncbi:unnamed protein product [Parajaminaea phylloscopi]
MPLHGELLTRLRNASLARLRRVPVPYSSANLSILSILLQQGLIHSVNKGTVEDSASPAAFQAATLPSRRLWVTLKYSSNDRPVLSQLELVSKPSKKVLMDQEELARFVSYRRTLFVKPLEMAEVGIVNAGKQGWWDAREAVKRGIKGGEVVAKAGLASISKAASCTFARY